MKKSMPPEVLNRIYQHLFTTEEWWAGGTGQVLSIAFLLLDREEFHGGNSIIR
jgi:signal transduction histidine kinase